MYLVALPREYPFHLRPCFPLALYDLAWCTHLCKVIGVGYMQIPFGSVFGMFLDLTLPFDLPACPCLGSPRGQVIAVALILSPLSVSQVVHYCLLKLSSAVVTVAFLGLYPDLHVTHLENLL